MNSAKYKRRRRHWIMQNRQRNPLEMKGHFYHKIGVVEDVVVEVEMVVEATRTTTLKEDSQVNKIGVVEDVVLEVAGRTPTSNATNAINMDILRRITTHTVATIVEKGDTLQKTV